MPIFMKYDGVEGNSTINANGGVWKTTNFLTTQLTNGVYLSKISLPNSPFGIGAVDSRDANAVSKVRMLFNTVFGFGLSGVVVLSVSRYNKFSSISNLRQLIITGRIDSQGRLLVATDSGIFPNVLEIKLFGATFSNLSTETAESAQVFSFSLNFQQVKCREITSRNNLPKK